jgi:hypothetical protein
VNYNLLWLIKYEDDDKEEMTTFELKRFTSFYNNYVLMGLCVTVHCMYVRMYVCMYVCRTLQIESSAAATPSSIVKSPIAPSNAMLGDLYINRRVRKMFNDKKMYEGTVTSSRMYEREFAY